MAIDEENERTKQITCAMIHLPEGREDLRRVTSAAG